MHFLLIDNCHLRDLIDHNGYSRHLTELQNLISSKQVRFFTHENIIEEWTRHKFQFHRKKEHKLLTFKASENSQPAPQQGAGQITTNHLANQIQAIDGLLSNAEILSTPATINAEFADRYKKRLAPFHKKLHSQSDWEIIGTYLNYCETNLIPKCYFLSANTTDFGAIDEANVLHPDLIIRFPKVKVLYYQELAAFFTDLRHEEGISSDLLSFNLVENRRYTFLSAQRKTALESLWYLYNDLFEEINLIPLHILQQYHPFASSPTDYASFSHFQMSDVDPCLLQFYKNLSIQKGGEVIIKDASAYHSIRDYEKKIDFVVQKVNDNLIFHIVSKGTNEILSTHYKVEQDDCCLDAFDNFKIAETIAKLSIEKPGFKHKLKQAYVYCQLTNYTQANEIYDDICRTAIDNKKYISYFIAKYNQKHLSVFLDNIFYNKSIDEPLIDRLSQIDPLEEAVKLKTFTAYKLLTFVGKDDFYNYTVQGIAKTVASIIDHYKSQLQGGWSVNYYIGQLEEDFVKMEEFLNANYIIYNEFLNYKDLFSTIIEGLFASYAISHKQDSRLESLHDYWIKNIIKYGDRKRITTLYRRYLAGFVEYTPGDHKQSLPVLLQNIITSKELCDISYNVPNPDAYHGLKYKWDDYFDNAITIAAIVKLSSKQLDQIIKSLLSYLSKQIRFRDRFDNPLTFFLNQHGDNLTIKQKQAFFKCYLQAKECDSAFGHAVISTFKPGELKINRQGFEQLKHSCFECCIKCGLVHEAALTGVLYDRLTPTLKLEMKTHIKHESKKDVTFEIFYVASLFDIIPADKNKLLYYVKALKPSDKTSHKPSFVSFSRYYVDSYVNALLNLTFKFQINTKLVAFKNIKTRNPYYEWLLDIDDFNYGNFDIEWLLIPRTLYFNIALAKSDKLVSHIYDYLTKHNHAGVEKALLQILYHKIKK